MGARISRNKGGYLYMSNPKEQLMEMLVDKTLSVGRMVTFKEASEDPGMVCPNNYAFYFGSFDEAAKLAWNKAKNLQQRSGISDSSAAKSIPVISKPLDSNKAHENYKLKSFKRSSIGEKKDTQDSITPEGNKPSRELIEEARPHIVETHSNIGRPREYDYEKVKDLVVSFYKEHGRFMTRSEVSTRGGEFPSWATIYNYLGPRSKWIDLVPQFTREEVAQRNKSSSESSEGLHEMNSNEKPIVTTQYHFEEDALLIELNILKPGQTQPIKITFSV